MTKAYIDTSVYTDALLKRDDRGDRARSAISTFTHTELPVYAIKEFKAGPLTYYAYLHNKFERTRSHSKTLGALAALAATPQRYRLSTALGALADISKSLGSKTNDQLIAKYGNSAKQDLMLSDEYRLMCRALIFRAWRRRRSLTSHVVQPLSCYRESEPIERRGQIILEDLKCNAVPECCLGPFLKSNKDELQKLKDANDSVEPTRERLRRSRVLKDLIRAPNRPLTEAACRELGDAVFSFFAPKDSVILTTNLRDHTPLARSLGKSTQSP